MRILLSTYGPPDTVDPMLALATHLRTLGAEAHLCAPPDSAGVTTPLGESVRALVTGTAPPSRAGVPERAAALADEVFAKLPALVATCDVVVGAGPLPVVAATRSVAEAAGVRYVYAAFSPVGLPSAHHRPHPRALHPLPADVTDNRELWSIDARNAHSLFGDMLNSRRAAVGLPPVADVRAYAFTDRPWLASDPLLGPWPDGPGDPAIRQTGAWLRRGERPLPPEVTAFLSADGPPPVYIGFGDSALRDTAIPHALVAAVRAQGLRAIIERGWADLSPVDDLGDCLSVGELDHHALFPQVAAVVHHGGAGVTTAAAAAGTPQVIVPQHPADHPYWAGRVASLGIGVAHDGPVPTAESLSIALKTVLTPETAARAADVAGEIRTDGALLAANLLLDGS